ncbi:MAG: hypothetical protein QW116_04155, partial [Zestosphaera sp.]
MKSKFKNEMLKAAGGFQGQTPGRLSTLLASHQPSKVSREMELKSKGIVAVLVLAVSLAVPAVLLITLSTAVTTFATSDWTTELWGWDRVSNSWVSGNLAGYPEGDLVGFKFIITNKQNVAAQVPQINSFYDYFNAGK